MSFPRYRKYKPSRAPGLSEVPDHWEVMALKRFGTLRMGQSPDSEDCNTEGIGFPFLQGCADFGAVHPLPVSYCSTAKKIAEPGEFLFSVRAPVGRLNIADQQYGIGRGLCGVLPDARAADRYAYYCLQELVNALQAVATGSTYEAVSVDQLGSVKSPLPPLSEQHAIAAFLDRETAKIDALVSEQARLIELLTEKRQAVISHAVTKGLDSTVPRKPSGIEWLGEMPAHWGTVQSRRLFTTRSEPAAPNDVQLTASQKYGVLPQSEFVEREGRRVVEVIMGLDKLKHVEPNDFIISMRSFQGGIEWCRMRGATSFHYVMLTPIKKVYPPFFAHLFKSRPYIQALQTTTDLIRDGQELRYSNFVMVDLPLVPDSEQRAIASFLDEAIPALDQLAAECEQAIALMNERRSALISAAVTGQIDVRNAVAAEVA